MKVLVVSQYFWPEPFRINDLCSGLVSRGYEVIVLTGEPNYPSGKKYTDYLQNKEKFNNLNGVKIVRVPIVSRGTSKLKLALNYLSFAITASALGIFNSDVRSCERVLINQLSPVTSALPGILIAKKLHIPCVMWVLDLWPESLKEAGGIKSNFLQKIFGILSKYIYKNCDLILAQSKSMQTLISDRVDNVPVNYFASWAEDLFFNFHETEYKSNNVLKILFAGNVGESQNFTFILSAIKEVVNSGTEIELRIVGDGRALCDCKKKVSELAISKYVKFMGRHPVELMPKFYESSDVCLVTLKDSFAFSITLPGKIQSYMAAGKPVLGVISGEGANILTESGCSYVSEPDDLNNLVKNIKVLSRLDKGSLRKMGENGRDYYLNNFSREKQLDKLEQFILEVESKLC